MKFLVLLCLFGAAVCEDKFAHQSVFDYMKTLTNPELYALIAQKAVQWPTYDSQAIPAPSFTCAEKKYPGFYADPATQCQTFHRCDPNGNLTSYICVNRTVFNPITLICDQWFNVDCAGLVKDEYFGNRRLYTNLPLFDSPNAGDKNDANSGKWVYVADTTTLKAPAKATEATEAAAAEA